ncbi:radical SAM/SPASM domain-containing protein [Clostridium sp. UBA1652]|uniref:radical SAM/SPASM domain-containing protein n=1 Tax=Clostridium sp. UBA1652 TaxID=1946348 RepID=UPI00257A856D|nr:radical SAM protein [Clostridium sp. UBA1652]
MIKEEVKAVKIFGNNIKTNADIFKDNDQVLYQIKQAQEAGIMPNALNAPLFVLWELTAKCPQNCIYCYNESPRRVDELCSKRIFEIADEILKMKVFNICITGGEPTMNKYYFELVRYLAMGGIQVGTVLSGANINEERAKMLATYLSVVQVSLDGSCAEIHDKLRNRKGSFDDAVNTIKLFVGLRMDVSISFAITKYNADDLENVYYLCKQLGVSSIRLQKLAVSGKVKGQEESVCATEEQYQHIFEVIEKYKGDGYIDYADPTVHINVGMETEIATLARITAEGDVCISPYFSAVFGNLKEESFRDCWNRMKKGWKNLKIRELIGTHVICEDECIYDRMPNKIYIGGEENE